MPEVLLLDTSAALALFDDGSERRARVIARVGDCRLGLAGHAVFEAYSTLTRMPPPMRVAPPDAIELLARAFPETRHASARGQSELFSALAVRGIFGGAVYDALVALAAREHDLLLLSCDRRAAYTYTAVGARFEVI